MTFPVVSTEGRRPEWRDLLSVTTGFLVEIRSLDHATHGVAPLGKTES